MLIKGKFIASRAKTPTKSFITVGSEQGKAWLSDNLNKD